MNKEQAKRELLQESRSLSKENNQQFKILSEDYGRNCELGYERGYTAGYQDCISSAIKKLCPDEEQDQEQLWDEVNLVIRGRDTDYNITNDTMEQLIETYTLIRK